MSIDTEQPTPSSDPRSETNGEYGRIEIEHADAAALALPVLDADAVAAPQPEPFSLDITALRRKLAENTGKEYWRSLDELAGSRDFQDMLQKEFPDGATEWQDPVSRRGFLKLMGASLAFGGVAGIAGCTVQPDEQIVPYVKAPEQFVPGRPLFFATVAQRGGYAVGVLAESHLGRPTKIEGNPDHPSSLGAADAIMQASILNLYDPDRSQSVLRRGEISTWEAFLQMIVTEQTEWKADGGAGLRILTETITSPTLADQIHQLLTAYPAAKWHQYEPTSRDNVREGARLAFGDVVETTYRFSGANVVVSLDADFMASMPGSLRYAREFADGRRVSSGVKKMNRLYVVETTPTVTGAMADHSRALRPAELENFAWSLAAALGVAPAGTAAATDGMIATIAKELQANRGTGIVIAGDEQPPAVHALAHAMNQALGNVGTTVIHTDPVVSSPINQIASLADLAADIDARRVTTLLVLGGNPVFNAPVDLRFSERYATVRNRIHLSMYDDETSRLSQWHIPENHYLETWGDARAHDGTVSIIQPLIAPMYGGKSSYDIIAALLGHSGVSVYDLVRNYWKGSGSTASASTGSDSSAVTGKAGARMQGDFGKGWQKALFDGFVTGTALTPKAISLKGDLAASLPKPAPVVAAGGNTLDIIFRPDPSIHDGRYANNGWLQEVPKPLSKLCWDNALLIAPATAEARKLENGDMVEVKIGEHAQRVPVWITPGHAAGSGTLYFGYGRTRAGNVGTKTGFDIYAIRTSGSPWHALGATITPTDDNYELATTQEHHSMEGRGLVRVGTLQEYLANPKFALEKEDTEELPSIYPEFQYYDPKDPNHESMYAWGMAIDLTACIGCNACVIACQSENNIPVVGKTQVINSREMHWIRIDRYYAGNDIDHPQALFQPLPCMHCEKAPCEPVCPVGATVHSSEGLNEMVYNRCVGTRYCSNNCPYKVRRFNFLRYTDEASPSLKMMRNPDVTVRSRGVMEKCTYCVQRINHARIEAKKDDRPIRDGEIVTACQQTCPTQAIVFGNINDGTSRVAKLKAKDQTLNYGLLAELGTQPRTSYLARLSNPNPEIKGVA